MNVIPMSRPGGGSKWGKDSLTKTSKPVWLTGWLGLIMWAGIHVCLCPSCLTSPQAQHANEVDEVIKDLKSYPGFGSYMIMNNDGEQTHLCMLAYPTPGHLPMSMMISSSSSSSSKSVTLLAGDLCDQAS